jgi:ComF family protein
MNVIDFIFPKKCLECGREGKYICETCIRKVRPGGWITLNEIKVYSIWKYEGVVKKAIIALKYKFATEVAKELINYVTLRPSKKLLVPIPSHWLKENLRGFNQSALLGEKLALKMGWEFAPKLLVKRRSTVSQVGLKKEARRQNLLDAFSLNSPDQVPNSVVLFDDVYTTGSTLEEAIKILKRAGIKKIWCLTVAR